MFLIHTDLVKRHSQTFVTDLELSSGAEKPELRITEHLAHHFKLFVAFLYTGRVYTITEGLTKTYHEWSALAELWSTGHALGSATFKDAVVDAMLQKRATKSKFSSHTYKLLADHLQTQAQMQTGVGKLLVDIAVSERKHEVYTKLSPKLECINFYGEVIRVFDQIRRGTESEQAILLRSKEGRDCLYHEHGTNGVCHEKMFPATLEGVRCAQDAMPK